ncbi:AraC family transcriptional regulator [Breoghania corrubedonensis]|uniref:AraC family transcriptional regulator n=1 Tax=Breoghania corrubedonensis TaxID=665038 RepID=A0A2T5V5T6_9HYPH|nr:AraC family transcriptional regulator [Breoghania corrubedonensis]PTW59101.1 AraC family transcriptional regulator [Breoghania corrubedonensis]
MIQSENGRKQHDLAAEDLAVLRGADISADGDTGDAFLVHCRSLNGLPNYLSMRGVDYSSLANQVGLGDADTTATDSYVALDAFAHLLELACEAADDECLALRWTSQDTEGNHGTLPLCLRYVPNLRVALETLSRFMSLHIDVSDVSVHFDGNATLSWRYSPLISRVNQITDRNACLFVSWLTTALPRSEYPVEVKLMRERPKSSALHRSLLSASLQFSCERNEIVFPGRSLDLPNPMADAHLFQALCDLNLRLMRERRRQDDIVLKVREEIMVVARVEQKPVSLEFVARRLGLSARGLQRRLAACGTSFNDLADGLRRDAAKRYLEETDLMVSEIAYRLGFSSIGNFTRAAKRWFGRSPRDYRSTMQSDREGSKGLS